MLTKHMAVVQRIPWLLFAAKGKAYAKSQAVASLSAAHQNGTLFARAAAMT
jgi:hypothetical protein